MSTLTVEVPESLRKTIEELAAKEGYSVTVISHRLQPKRNRVG
jgi:peptide subunit release factor 1 (eRF1)